MKRSAPDAEGVMGRQRRLIRTLGTTALAWATLGLPGVHGQTLPTPGHPATPQDPDPNLVRVGIGLGPATMGGGEQAVGIRFAVSMPKRQHALLTFRGSLAEEFNIFGPFPAENVWDVGVLLGRESRGRGGYASASAGVAFVGGLRRGERIPQDVQCYDWLGCALTGLLTPVEYTRDPFRTLGIPFELEAGLTSSKIGVSVNAFGDLNTVRSMAGLSVGIIFGRLR